MILDRTSPFITFAKPARSVLLTAVALLLSIAAASARAEQAGADPLAADRWRESLADAWWVGPLLTPGAESPAQGHGAVEPYLYDVISGGQHHPATLAYLIYGVTDNLTVGIRPTFAIGSNYLDRGLQMADWKLLSHVRLTHFTPDHRIPTIAVALLEVLPTGRYDRLDRLSQGQGSGFFSTEIGLQMQDYFLLPNGRPLRVRFDLLHSIPGHARVRDRSVYGTGEDFRGTLFPGQHTSFNLSAEYSVSKRWVAALELVGDVQGRSRIEGRGHDGAPTETLAFAGTRAVSFAPNIEYSWSGSGGIVAAVRIKPAQHGSPSSITPAIAFDRSF